MSKGFFSFFFTEENWIGVGGSCVKAGVHMHEDTHTHTHTPMHAHGRKSANTSKQNSDR